MSCIHPAYRKELRKGEEVLICTRCKKEFGEEEVKEFKGMLEGVKKNKVVNKNG